MGVSVRTFFLFSEIPWHQPVAPCSVTFFWGAVCGFRVCGAVAGFGVVFCRWGQWWGRGLLIAVKVTLSAGANIFVTLEADEDQTLISPTAVEIAAALIPVLEKATSYAMAYRTAELEATAAANVAFERAKATQPAQPSPAGAQKTNTNPSYG